MEAASGPFKGDFLSFPQIIFLMYVLELGYWIIKYKHHFCPKRWKFDQSKIQNL